MNPNGLEFGTVDVSINKDGKKNILFRGVPDSFQMHVCHTQSVLALPPGAVNLATSNREAHQAFVVGESAWGVQFHPEFNEAVVRGYIRVMKKSLIEDNQNPEELKSGCTPTPYAGLILRNFAGCL